MELFQLGKCSHYTRVNTVILWFKASNKCTSTSVWILVRATALRASAVFLPQTWYLHHQLFPTHEEILFQGFPQVALDPCTLHVVTWELWPVTWNLWPVTWDLSFVPAGHRHIAGFWIFLCSNNSITNNYYSI